MTLPGIHHLSLGVRDLARSLRFYDAVLAPLGLVRVWSDLRPGQAGQGVGYGPTGAADVLALKARGDQPPGPGTGFHLAFAAPSRAAVDEFYKAALAHGGESDGAPGLRPAYGEHYYAAFVRDPDGHRLEAVVDSPDSAAGAG